MARTRRNRRHCFWWKGWDYSDPETWRIFADDSRVHVYWYWGHRLQRKATRAAIKRQLRAGVDDLPVRERREGFYA